MRTRVKICGITRVEDALAATQAGADAVGLVFYAKSRRFVTAERAREICLALPPFVSRVGLFLDADDRLIRETLDSVPLDLLQFHGDECPADCPGYGLPYIKAVGMQGKTDVARYAASYPDAAGFLLDSHATGEAGGTGLAFDWGRMPADLDVPLILAGGLAPENVAEAVRTTGVYGVDVSSGVESAPGIKDHEKIRTFIKEVERVDCERLNGE
ncbi:MAG: phosphoribosylanthranilate isomerase [Gammaproteobacteria bacterium]|jgi:phosphoribosylanthranilate isomerase